MVSLCEGVLAFSSNYLNHSIALVDQSTRSDGYGRTGVRERTHWLRRVELVCVNHRTTLVEWLHPFAQTVNSLN